MNPNASWQAVCPACCNNQFFTIYTRIERETVEIDDNSVCAVENDCLYEHDQEVFECTKCSGIYRMEQLKKEEVKQ